VPTLKRMRATLTRIASRIANRSVSQAFDRWADAAAELRRTRVILSRTTSKLANRSTARAGAYTRPHFSST
jgi:hypothetical protein